MYYHASVNKIGSMRTLARTSYSRTIWAIMSKFNVLPTSKEFKELTTEQIDWIVASMLEDNRQADAIARGVKLDGDFEDTDDYENKIYNNPTNDWELVKKGHDPNKIFAQVNAMTKDKEVEQSIQRKIEDLKTNGVANKERQVEMAKKQVEDTTKEIFDKINKKEQFNNLFDDDDFTAL